MNFLESVQVPPGRYWAGTWSAEHQQLEDALPAGRDPYFKGAFVSALPPALDAKAMREIMETLQRTVEIHLLRKAQAREAALRQSMGLEMRTTTRGMTYDPAKMRGIL